MERLARCSCRPKLRSMRPGRQRHPLHITRHCEALIDGNTGHVKVLCTKRSTRHGSRGSSFASAIAIGRNPRSICANAGERLPTPSRRCPLLPQTGHELKRAAHVRKVDFAPARPRVLEGAARRDHDTAAAWRQVYRCGSNAAARRRSTDEKVRTRLSPVRPSATKSARLHRCWRSVGRPGVADSAAVSTVESRR